PGDARPPGPAAGLLQLDQLPPPLGGRRRDDPPWHRAPHGRGSVFLGGAVVLFLSVPPGGVAHLLVSPDGPPAPHSHSGLIAVCTVESVEDFWIFGVRSAAPLWLFPPTQSGAALRTPKSQPPHGGLIALPFPAPLVYLFLLGVSVSVCGRLFHDPDN